MVMHFPSKIQTVICLTPVKNEAWCLDRFLKAASLWADIIIIADQMSTDGSREIANSFPKVKLIDNESHTFNELGRKRLLINEARKVLGLKLLITLDADEMFSPEIFSSGEWDYIKKLPPGTAIDFQWSNLSQDGKTMWKGYYFPWGYIDDDVQDYDVGISEGAIHCSRVPIKSKTPHYKVKSFSVIHFQYTNWLRMQHKHYYYQCLEVINNPNKSAIDIYRQYHHMFAIKESQLVPVPIEWISWYKERDILIDDVVKEELYWFDQEILKFFKEYGVKKFRKVDIWEFDWSQIAQKSDLKIKDPRRFIDKIILKWLKYTQNMSSTLFIRRIERFFKYTFNF